MSRSKSNTGKANQPTGRRSDSRSASEERLDKLYERAKLRQGRAHGETLFNQVTREVKEMVKEALTSGSRVTRTLPGPTPRKAASQTKSSQAEMAAAIERSQSEERRRLSKLCLRIRKAQLAKQAQEEAEMAAEYAKFRAEAAQARKDMENAGLTPEQVAEAEEWLAAWGV